MHANNFTQLTLLPTIRKKFRALLIVISALFLSFISLIFLGYLGAFLWAAEDSGATVLGLPVFELFMRVVSSLFLSLLWMTDLLGIDPQSSLYQVGFFGVLFWWLCILSLVGLVRARIRGNRLVPDARRWILTGCLVLITTGGIYNYTRQYISCVPEYSNNILGPTAEEAAKNYYAFRSGRRVFDPDNIRMTEIFAPAGSPGDSLYWVPDSRYFIVSLVGGTYAQRIGVKPTYGGPRCQGWELRESGPVE